MAKNKPCGNKQTYIGSQIAICPADREPVYSDTLGEIVEIGEFGASMSVIDSTSVSNTSGFTTKLPSNRDWEPIPVTVFTNGENFNRVYQQFFANNPTEDGIFCKIVIVMPKRKDWINKPTPVFEGFVSAFRFGAVNNDSAQQFSFEFTPCGVPGLFNGWASVESISADPVELGTEGGDVTFTLSGDNLIDNIMVKGFNNNRADANTIGYTSGTDTEQVVTIKYPANNSDEDKVYTVKVSLDGGNTYEDKVTTVTVAGVTA